MSLNGSLLIVVLALLTLAAFTGVVLLWRRLSGKTWRHVLGRIGVLCGAQLVLVMLLAVLSNDLFGFYGSWHDLLGFADQTISQNQPGAPSVPAGQAGRPQKTLLTVQSTSGLDLPGGATPSATGELQNVTIYGQSTGLSTQAAVYLPPQYFQRAYRSYQFPAAIVSTGYPGDLQGLENELRYPYRLLTGINNAKDRPIVLVMMQPSPTSVGGRDTECTNIPGGPQVNTFWAQDVPTAIETHYASVTSAARGWGIIGDSTGGDCAVKVSLMNSDRIEVAVSLSGDFNAPEDITTGDLYANARFRDTNNVLWRLRHLPKPPIAVRLATSRTGESDYQAVREFATLTQGTPTRTSTLIRNNGGHNFTTWNAEVPPALQWLTTTLQSPTPLPAPPN